MLFWIAIYVCGLFLLAKILRAENYRLKPKAMLSGMLVCSVFGAFSYYFMPHLDKKSFIQVFLLLYLVKCVEYISPDLYHSSINMLLVAALICDRLVCFSLAYVYVWRRRNDSLELCWDSLKKWDRRSRG